MFRKESYMRSCFFALLLLCSATEAATVTIDFQEFYDPDSDLTFSPVGNIETKGFSVETSGIGVWLPDFIPIGLGNMAVGVGDLGSTLTISSVDGQAFNMEAFDYAAVTDSSMTLSAVRANGTTSTVSYISSWPSGNGGYDTYEAMGVFNNILSFTLAGVTATPQVDNFRLTTVPVPAALWLFGSALAGLGWARRK